MKAEKSNPIKEKATTNIIQKKKGKSFVKPKADASSFTPPIATGKQHKSLPAKLQSNMESSLGHDFSNVGIHTNSQKAVQMNARAFTQAEQIHFAPGEFNPSSTSGQNLIGHEFTHVAQQRAGVVKPTKALQKGVMVNDDKGLESEADNYGRKAARGEAVSKYRSAGLGMRSSVRTAQAKSNVVQAKFVVEGATATIRDKFLKKINSSSMKFDMDASGNLTQRFMPQIPIGEYETQVHNAIYASQTVKFKLVAKSDKIFIDSFASGEVDASDMLNLSTNLFQTNVIHVLAERFAVADYEKNKSTATFKGPHKKGIEAEERFLKEKFPKKTIKYKGAALDNSTKKVDKNGTGTVDYYFDYTDVKQVYTQSLVKGKLIEDVVSSKIEIVK